ncbi:hypothetical protein [Fluviicola chungangensis]|uniref:Lipoprotein n=1 Tax=Fluviicola chungangensis TaxID=2597671 RepID=A0A556MQZ3_9FLAO|nr:hypothetical protein [Fluviicola chungangensis]TSJ42337.1 hypothetical protein FO442_11250 [Fluviicola chungangensis]
MKFFLFITLFASFLFSCNTTKPVAPDNTIISITHGTNFGHCRGYCRKEVVFSEDQIVYFESSVDSTRNPVKTEKFDNSSAKWKSIADKIDWNTFKNLEESYGCPDCADGGSEYIEIKTTNGTKRVTIEFNKENPELEPLLTELRTQRKTLLGK